MTLDLLRQILCVVLALGALGHLYGTFAGYPVRSETFVWSLSGTVLALTVAALNWLAPGTTPALTALAGLSALAWGVIALLFGRAIGNVADPRALIHAAWGLGLGLLWLLG